jgi:hypothetical protein
VVSVNIGALPELVLAWFKNQGLDLLQAGKDPLPQGQFKPGQQYEGQVLDNLPNGRNLIQVAGQKLDMALPQQAKPGDVIRLTYVQAGPRPTFVLNVSAAATSQSVSVSQAAQQVSALTRYASVTAATATASATATPQVQQAAAPGSAVPVPLAPMAKPIIADPAVLLSAATPSNVSVLSSIATAVSPVTMMLDEAVGNAQASVPTNANLATTQSVAADQAATTQVLPMRLQQTVKESGLFYESHLGKWANGDLSLASIQREPQAALAKTPGTLLNVPDLDGMPEQAANLASRQLNMLEGGPFVWQGQAWPGQNMEWQVSDRDGGSNAGEVEAQKWHSQLRLTLPRLGGVAADLDIGALGLRVRLTAQTPEALAEMKAAMPDLAERMRGSELNLTSLKLGLADDRT